ncbi:MAG: DUF3857 domain-containing protein [Bacteroidetes bacterium]|nr:DUF3857 domain-containing protein [Bacteroidota bacterium]MBL7104827.1 DUF3857 domain-containing protein [Bacteroidales bacterium]
MNKSKLVILLYIFLPFWLISKENFYPSYLIPENLLKDATAVIRLKETVITIKSDRNAHMKEYVVKTILNKAGDDHAAFLGFYDKDKKIGNIKIKIYDAGGKLIENVRGKDIFDVSLISGFSLYDDNRIKYYKPHIKDYPFTVEMEYTMNFNGYIQLPWWQPQYSNDVSVEKATLKVITYTGVDIRYRVCKINNEIEVKKYVDQNHYFWTINDLPAFDEEPFSPPLREYVPIIYLAPSDFYYKGYSGNMETWGNFTKWIRVLLEDRDQLPDERQTAIKELTETATDTIEMIQRIYEYVQENTRYVSIQFGIGGFQPFEASIVDKYGYGDCKALTNYTMSLLKAAGIKSNYTLVYAGKNETDILNDFSSQQFNHVILNVPLQYDTVWLECTNQDIPFGYLGNFTNNRYALDITDNSGDLIRTPDYPQKDNVQACYANVIINDGGKAQAQIELTYTGLMYDEVFGFINEDDEEQKKWLYKNLDVPNFNIEEYSVHEEKKRIPKATINLEMELPKYASVTGKRMFIPLNILNKYEDIPKEDEERKTDIYLRKSFIIYDSIVYTLPGLYIRENFPAQVQFSSLFGEYSSSITTVDQKVIYIRKLRMSKGRYPKTMYQDFKEFCKKIVKSDKAKLVLKKSDE